MMRHEFEYDVVIDNEDKMFKFNDNVDVVKKELSNFEDGYEVDKDKLYKALYELETFDGNYYFTELLQKAEEVLNMENIILELKTNCYPDESGLYLVQPSYTDDLIFVHYNSKTHKWNSTEDDEGEYAFDEGSVEGWFKPFTINGRKVRG